MRTLGTNIASPAASMQKCAKNVSILSAQLRH